MLIVVQTQIPDPALASPLQKAMRVALLTEALAGTSTAITVGEFFPSRNTSTSCTNPDLTISIAPLITIHADGDTHSDCQPGYRCLSVCAQAGYAGTCTLPSDHTSCPNGSSPSRLFAKRARINNMQKREREVDPQTGELFRPTITNK